MKIPFRKEQVKEQVKEIKENKRELISKQVSLDVEAYNILLKIRTQLINKHLRNFTFSDAVRELNLRTLKGGK